jgi:flagellar basal body rod protein FlgB
MDRGSSALDQQFPGQPRAPPDAAIFARSTTRTGRKCRVNPAARPIAPRMKPASMAAIPAFRAPDRLAWFLQPPGHTLARPARQSPLAGRRRRSMSLFGALNTAISGLTAQSSAFSNISDNVANSQTVGYKQVDTSFTDYLTTSTASVNESGSVVALPAYANNVQGTITQSTDTTALAISGQGFFAVSQQNGTVSGQPTFSQQQDYTRTGDFQMDTNGYLVNSAGGFLNGWTVNPATGVANQNSMAPIQVTQT